jgi:DNA primase catalytic core
MAALDLRSVADLVKVAVPLVDAMEEAGIEFVSRGGDSWKARCFLHDDPGPSLVVSPAKGLFHCFSTGCQARGDVISFCQLWNNLDFSEAVRELAARWGLISASELDGEPTPTARLVAISIDVMRELNRFLLKDKQAAHVLAYAKKRGVSEATSTAHLFGYSPSCDYAARVARKAGATAEEVKRLQFDRPSLFGGRMVFPIICPRRSGVFTYGSLVERKTVGPKYVGATSEHPLRWSGPVFGLQEARQHARKARTLVLVEGFFDVLALHSAGTKHVVGTLGSNPTIEQFAMLKSYSVPSTTVLFDGDRGGDAGIQAAIKNANGMRTHVAFLPSGDPDEYVLEHGRDALDSVLEQAISPIDYLINEAATDFAEGTVYVKSDRLGKLLRAVRTMPAHEAAVAVAELGKLSGIPQEVVQDLLAQVDTLLEAPEESEKVVLAGAMQDAERYLAAELRVGARNVWASQRNRVVWDAIVSARRKNATLLTPELLIGEVPTKLKLGDFLAELETHPASNYEYHLSAVIDAAVRRALQAAGIQLKGEAANQSRKLQDVVAKHMTSLANASTTQAQVEFTAQEQVKSAMDYLHEQLANGGKVPGLSLGVSWRTFMDTLLGFQPGYFYIVSALPKTGKSMLGLNWALELAVHQNIPGVWLNGEMTERDLALRNLAILSGVSAMRIRRGAISAEEKALVDAAAARYYASPLRVVNTAGFTVYDAVNAMRKAVFADGARWVVLDYIQLLRTAGSSSNSAYWEKHMEISTELKAAVARMPVPLIAISQQSKASIEGGGAANQGGTFKYVQDCDVALDLRRRTSQEMQEDGNGNMQLSVDFNRHGPMDVAARLLFNTDNLRMEEV